jgi:hypothetical protein
MPTFSEQADMQCMLGKTEIALSAAIILSAVFPTSAATKHHRVTPANRAIYRTVPSTGGCTASGGPECSGSCSGSGPCAPPDRP